MKKICPLCNNDNSSKYAADSRRSYYQCNNCGLIFVPENYHLSKKEEKKRYDLHENDPCDQNYRHFLSRLSKPLNKQLRPQSTGLDFGSGPGPALHLMFEEKGHSMEIYDPYYENNPTVFEYSYDFITATEVAEHLSNPSFEFNRLWNCLKAGGWLGIMTKQVPVDQTFDKWHYIRDDTHIAFYSKKTFRWIANQWNAGLTFFGTDVVIFQKRKR